MGVTDEKDYIMRVIKEMASVLFSLMLGRQYASVELPDENKYEVSGKALREYEKMVDRGLINEAENMLLEDIDYAKKEEVLVAISFYQYVAEKDAGFLARHNYTAEEALDGLKLLAKNMGYGEMTEMFQAF